MPKTDNDNTESLEVLLPENSESVNGEDYSYEHREAYQDLFNHVPCYITVQDKNFRLLRYNKEFQEAFDPEPESFCYQAYKGRSEKCDFCPVEQTFSDGLPHLSEETGPGKQGDPLHWLVKTSPIKDANGDIVAVMEMCLDITYKKELEYKLESSERRYREIFNNIPNPLFVLDDETLNILDCNRSMNSVYGYSRDEIINEPFSMFFKPEERENYSSLMKTQSMINKAKHFTKNEEQIYVNIRISPSEHLDKKTLLVTTSDITQHLEVEEQLVQASKMATLGEMATGVAHELNQPLTVIKTASNFLARKIFKNEEILETTLRNLSNKITNNVDRATKIINHLRDFGRKSDITLEKVYLNRVMQRAYDVLGQQLKLREIKIEWSLEDRLPAIEADSLRLEQVFINLLLNARDAIEEKSEKIGEKNFEKRIGIKSRSQNNEVIIEISDSGTGVPDGIKDKIFDPFFTTKKVGKGTGLGLSISYGIIKDCNGNIELVSEKGEGTKFIIKLPISR